MTSPILCPMLRPALASDAEAIARLAGELGYPSSSAAVSARLGCLAKDRSALAVVAETAGEVTAWMHVAEVCTLDCDPFAEIVGLVVGAATRGQGVGAALVAAAVAWARERGLGTLRVRSNVVRERAHRFYERQGFHTLKTQRVFVMKLEP